MKLTGTQLGDLGRLPYNRDQAAIRRAFEEGVRSERERCADIVDDGERRGAFTSKRAKQAMLLAVQHGEPY